MALGATHLTRGGRGSRLVFARNSGDWLMKLRRGWEGFVLCRSGNGSRLCRRNEKRSLDGRRRRRSGGSAGDRLRDN
jgi:hypothetical protein